MKIERDQDHRYFVVDRGKRREMVGVTRSLIAANLVDDEWFNDAGRTRGQLVAHFAEKIATNTLDRPIPDEIALYMVGLRKFLDKYSPRVLGAEVMLADPVRELAGTVDLDVDRLLGFDATIDIKTGKPEPWHALQLAAYAYLKRKSKWMQQRRFGLYLNAAGGFRLLEYDEPSDLEYFFRVHDVLRWRIAHGTFERPYGRSEFTGSTVVHDGDRGDWRDRFDGDTPF
jgi:hypothetical protein